MRCRCFAQPFFSFSLQFSFLNVYKVIYHICEIVRETPIDELAKHFLLFLRISGTWPKFNSSE